MLFMKPNIFINLMMLGYGKKRLIQPTLPGNIFGAMLFVYCTLRGGAFIAPYRVKHLCLTAAA